MFALIHSPLVGPYTWALVADELRRTGIGAAVPVLAEVDVAHPPFWQQHAEAAAQMVKLIPPDRPPILVGHSGAGMLLPVIRQTLSRPVAGYIFVDAGLPKDGMSRLDLFESAEEAEQFRQAAKDGLLPTWSDEDLREVIPNDEVRRRFVAELRPLPLVAYEEPLPVFTGWPDAPCGYLQFSSVYDQPARDAQGRGWPYTRIDGGHFHMLVDPSAVASALVNLAAKMGIRR